VIFPRHRARGAKGSRPRENVSKTMANSEFLGFAGDFGVKKCTQNVNLAHAPRAAKVVDLP